MRFHCAEKGRKEKKIKEKKRKERNEKKRKKCIPAIHRYRW